MKPQHFHFGVAALLAAAAVTAAVMGQFAGGAFLGLGAAMAALNGRAHRQGIMD